MFIYKNIIIMDLNKRFIQKHLSGSFFEVLLRTGLDKTLSDETYSIYYCLELLYNSKFYNYINKTPKSNIHRFFVDILLNNNIMNYKIPINYTNFQKEPYNFTSDEIIINENKYIDYFLNILKTGNLNKKLDELMIEHNIGDLILNFLINYKILDPRDPKLLSITELNKHTINYFKWAPDCFDINGKTLLIELIINRPFNNPNLEYLLDIPKKIFDEHLGNKYLLNHKYKDKNALYYACETRNYKIADYLITQTTTCLCSTIIVLLDDIIKFPEVFIKDPKYKMALLLTLFDKEKFDRTKSLKLVNYFKKLAYSHFSVYYSEIMFFGISNLELKTSSLNIKTILNKMTNKLLLTINDIKNYNSLLDSIYGQIFYSKYGFPKIDEHTISSIVSYIIKYTPGLKSDYIKLLLNYAKNETVEYIYKINILYAIEKIECTFKHIHTIKKIIKSINNDNLFLDLCHIGNSDMIDYAIDNLPNIKINLKKKTHCFNSNDDNYGYLGSNCYGHKGFDCPLVRLLKKNNIDDTIIKFIKKYTHKINISETTKQCNIISNAIEKKISVIVFNTFAEIYGLDNLIRICRIGYSYPLLNKPFVKYLTLNKKIFKQALKKSKLYSYLTKI